MPAAPRPDSELTPASLQGLTTVTCGYFLWVRLSASRKGSTIGF